MSKKKVADIPSGARRSLREEVDEIVRASLSYDQKKKALMRIVTRQDAERILGPDPKDEITLRDPLGGEVLSLVIQRRFFDQIMSGEKTEEYRLIPETMPGRYTYKGEDGRRYLRPFGRIRFAVGYHRNRDTALVEVKDIETNGELVTFKLGRILEYKPKNNEHPF